MQTPAPKENQYINPTLLITPDGGVANVGIGNVDTLPYGGVSTIVPQEAIITQTEAPAKPNPYTNTLPVTTPTIPYNVPATPPSTLDGIVSLSKTTSDRQYLKGSGRKVPDDFIVTTNTSNVLTVSVNMTGTAGVSFEPSQFNLSPLEQKNITVHFDYIQFETLPEGLNQINAIVDVSAISMIEQPVTVTRPAIILPSPYQPADNPSLPTFPIQPPTDIQTQVVTQTGGGEPIGGGVEFDNVGNTYVSNKQGSINQI